MSTRLSPELALVVPDAPPAPASSVPVITEALLRTPPVVARNVVRDWGRESQEIFDALSGERNAWSELTAYSTLEDAHRLRALASVLTLQGANEILVRFYDAVLGAQRAMSPRVRAFFAQLPEDWYAASPLYYTYPHSMGVADGQKRGTLDDLRAQLPYLRDMGFQNIQLLPHWKSAGGDGGYDISGFEVAEDLGGDAAFARLLDDAMDLDIRFITDFIPNHISVRHPWFRQLLAGDETKLDWFLAMDDAKLVGTEFDEKGKLRVLLENAQGVVSKPWAIFPHASQKNLIDIEVNGNKHQMFHSFYPFQVDLNLRNPEVLGELFKVLGREAAMGVAGKRMDAAPHWFKEEGTNYENLPGTHALQSLFKLFVRHAFAAKGITVPEVGEGLSEASSYFGEKVEILGKPSTSEGDAMFGFEWNSTMWAMLLDEKPALFWDFVHHLNGLRPGTFWFNLGRHHDEMRTDLMPDGVRQRVEAKLLARGAQMFAGRGVGGRMADFLEKDPRQIAKAFFVNYLAPGGVPVVYYGDEVGAENQVDFMAEEQARRLPILQDLGFPIHDTGVALDTRDVGRGGVSASFFAQAKAAGYLPLRTVRALNQLWATRPSLARGEAFPLATQVEEHVLAVVKWARTEDVPLLGLVNLTGERVEVRLSVSELREKLRGGAAEPFALNGILTEARDGRERRFEIPSDLASVVIPLEPHEHFLLETVA